MNICTLYSIIPLSVVDTGQSVGKGIACLCYNTAVCLVIVILTTLYPGLKNTGCVLCCVASAADLRGHPRTCWVLVR